MIKRITLLGFAFMAFFVVRAQDPIFFEDFEGSNSMPSGWTVYDEDGLNPSNSFMTEAWIVGDITDEGNNMAWSTSYYNPPGQADDWLVTPQISLPDIENLVLTFDAYPLDESFPDNYEVWISTTGNEPSDFNVKIFEDLNPIGGVIHSEGVSLEDYAGEEVYIAFRNVANDEFFLGIDNVTVKEADLGLDLEVLSIDVDSYLEQGDVEINTTVKNNGGSAINSFDITWAVGEDEYTETISDVNISFNETYQVVHSDLWNAVSGEYTIAVEVSNINNEGDDENTDNDSIEKNINVATNSVQRKPLYEEFTSSTCGPCYVVNTNLFNPFFSTKDYDEHSLVKYQVNFPGNGDPYYTDEVGNRRAYYGVNAAPTMVFEGEQKAYGTMTEMENSYQTAFEKPAFFDIDLEATKSGKEISVNMITTPYISGTFTLHVAVVEKLTTGNKTTNGETEFHQVMMKMLPNAAGTEVTFTSDEAYILSFEDYNLEDTNIEDFNNLQVVVWIQDQATKAILQSENTADSEALDLESFEVSTIDMYPNPAENILNISTENEVDIVISDLLGQKIISQSIKEDEQIDISHLSKGVYLVNFIQNTSTVTKKLIVK